MKFQGDVLNFCDFIQVFVFTRNHHLNQVFRTTKTLVIKMMNVGGRAGGWSGGRQEFVSGA